MKEIYENQQISRIQNNQLKLCELQHDKRAKKQVKHS